jgi:PAS domain S-box-containing protein
VGLVDGREIEVNITGAPLRDEAGAIVGAVAISRDVTERRRLERESRRLASMLERAHDAIFMWELGGPIRYWNRGAEMLYGFSRDEAVGRISHDLLQTQRHVTREVFEAELTRAGEWAGELTHTTSDGRRIEVLSRQQLLHEPDGRRFVLETSRDITERNRLAQRTQDTLSALLQMAEVLVTLPDEAAAVPAGVGASPTDKTPERVVTRRLAELTRGILGCSRVSITALDGEQLFTRPVAIAGLSPELERRWWAEQEALAGHPFGRGAVPEDLRRLLAGETVMFDLTRPPYELPNPYGVTVILAAPMHVQGRMVGLLGLDFQDVGGVSHVFTQEEMQIAEAVARLGAVVLDRDRLLHEREEARARELALQEANARMDEFLGIASHELRTPLTSASANVQMAERDLRALTTEETLPDTVSSQLQRAHMLVERTHRQMSRLDRLVGDLLDISRIQAGRLELRPEPCELLGIVREAVREQRAAWPDRTITLDLPRREIEMVGDTDRIGQVVTNYLGNALKYAPEDEPVVVRVRRQHDGTALVEVTDGGPGLSPDQQEGLFERFHRVPGIEQQNGSGVGLGLGLYICRTIVERHGGTLGVESAAGTGSTFWFTLPLAAVE